MHLGEHPADRWIVTHDDFSLVMTQAERDQRATVRLGVPDTGLYLPHDQLALSSGFPRAGARGWLRPPLDGELLARARADVVAARETLRKTNGRVAALEAQLADRNGP